MPPLAPRSSSPICLGGRTGNRDSVASVVVGVSGSIPARESPTLRACTATNSERESDGDGGWFFFLLNSLCSRVADSVEGGLEGSMLASTQPVQPLQATNLFGAAIAAVDLLSKVVGPAAGL